MRMGKGTTQAGLIAAAAILPWLAGGEARAANGAYAVDAADISETGSCKVESWMSMATNTDFSAVANPSCVVDPFKLVVNRGRNLLCDVPTCLNGNDAVPRPMEYNSRRRDRRKDLPHVDVERRSAVVRECTGADTETHRVSEEVEQFAAGSEGCLD